MSTVEVCSFVDENGAKVMLDIACVCTISRLGPERTMIVIQHAVSWNVQASLEVVAECLGWDGGVEIPTRNSEGQGRRTGMPGGVSP